MSAHFSLTPKELSRTTTALHFPLTLKALSNTQNITLYMIQPLSDIIEAAVYAVLVPDIATVATDTSRLSELKVLPSPEYAVSSKLSYKPFQLQLQELITQVYDWKYELYNLDSNRAEERAIVEQLNGDCECTTKRIERLLKAYVSDEQRAHSELSLLSLAVYKCHLQQLAIERRYGQAEVDKFLAGRDCDEDADWQSLKAAVPHKCLSSIGIIAEHVKPFLLDVRTTLFRVHTLRVYRDWRRSWWEWSSEYSASSASIGLPFSQTSASASSSSPSSLSPSSSSSSSSSWYTALEYPLEEEDLPSDGETRMMNT